MAFFVAACGGKTSSDAPVDGGSDVGDETIACPSEPVTKEEVAATPRADAELEMLALFSGASIVADAATYDRMVRDVDAIRTGNPAVSDIHVRLPYTQQLRVFADRATAQSMQAGTYRGWDCENAFWGVTSISDFSFATDGSSGSALVTFKGNYAVDRLACRYRSLPGVFQIQNPGLLVGDGPTLFSWQEGDVFHYAFDRAGGDCPAGCTTHHVWHYSTTSDGAITLVEEIDTGAYGPPPSPSWWTHRTPRLDPCLTR